MTAETAIRRALIAYRDARAVRRGPRGIARRVARRVYGKATGRLARRLFG
jgi:hypothetical protein